MKMHALRLLPGEDLKFSLQKFAKDKKITAAALVTCVGSLQKLCLRMANSSHPTELEEKFEIVSLVGTLSLHGSHLHISVSNNSGVVTGGHLLAGNIIFTTAEIVLCEMEEFIFLRKEDKITGYKELLVSSKKK